MYERYLSANPILNEQRSVRYEPLPSTLENLGKIEDQTAPKVELKTLPSSLRYAYLGPNCTYPIIVNAELTDEQEDKLLRRVRPHRKIIGYTIDDLKGIHASISCIKSTWKMMQNPP